MREVFTAKPGNASKLAKLFKQVFAKTPKMRVMTDVVGPYNTVVVEMEIEKLEDWVQMMADMKAGKPDPNMDPDAMKMMEGYTEMYIKGRREIFQVI